MIDNSLQCRILVTGIHNFLGYIPYLQKTAIPCLDPVTGIYYYYAVQ
ncbi:hypothetical protein TVNIR_1139 [Thioalkalivibrio nitratireducens DSM 14787]|uniref:Uncharacterized protein n=1 Tax=Thioalkalivibrio nitratireducens (strain DSM 14787 / UNIQEM 213 / ALEN2) TaxID=1255043 RepID=L0DWR9_THIND|nr:hypothetical protein TVNIR_1139 [Thioalkalivibrio nitratireducens DSM 14787]